MNMRKILNRVLFGKELRIIVCVLAVLLLYPQLNINNKKSDKMVADKEISVKIVSFMRGEVTDLRSSELLEARVEGYEGNVQDLTYTWTNRLGTYLYTYNSHNMYNIMNTDGEIEIRNKFLNRIYNGGGKGFAWACVYGANLGSNNDKNNSLSGGISVKVTDKEGNLIGEAQYDNKFLEPNIQEDLKNSVFGLFVGEKVNIKDLLGESALVHVDCVESKVNSGDLITGTNVATLYKENDDYYLEGLNKGVATVELSMTKTNCKFHQYMSGKVETKAYVFKKPYVKTTTTTLMLADLDEDCSYYLNGVKGVVENGVIVFNDLTPNTDYQVEVVAEYKNTANETKKVYTYLYEQTKPVYLGTVYTYLDNKKTNIEEILDNENGLYLKEEKSTHNNFIKMNKADAEKGTYSTVLENGIYNIYVKNNDNYELLHYQQLIINNSNRERNMYFYSVTYDSNGGKFSNGNSTYIEKYHENNPVTSAEVIPIKEGYRFEGWNYGENLYLQGDEITSAINNTIVLKAKWTPIQDKVNIKFIINHESSDGEVDSKTNQNLIMHLTHKGKNDTTYHSSNGDNVEYSYKASQWKEIGKREGNTTTVDLGTVFDNLSYEYDYSANTGMAGYKVTDMNVSTIVDNYGNTTYNLVVNMRYSPDIFTMNFDVEMAEDVDKSLWPESVDVKVIKWYDTSEFTRDFTGNGWFPIEEHITGTRAVRFDENGKSNSVYQVKVYKDKDLNLPFYYRIQIVGLHMRENEYVSFEDKYNDGSTFVAKDDTYNAVINVTNGVVPSTYTSNSGVYGIYSDKDNKYVQVGHLKATIDIDTYKIKLDANGGTFTDSTTEKSLDNLIKIPDISASEYVPTRKNQYVFKGWYYKNRSNEEVNLPAKGTWLNTLDLEDDTLTLYARWAEPLTISGTVSAAGTYMLNGEEVAIHLTDLPSGVKVLLQEVGADGAGYTIRELDKKFLVIGKNKVNKIKYTFTGIPDNGKEYQISILATNYEVTFQNSITGGDETDYSKYNKNDNKAIFEENETTAFVNMYLSFKPEEFNVDYEVDASEIKKEFRPKDIEIKILYDDLISGNNAVKWPVISQHDKGGVINNFGTDGKLYNSYPVWIYACNNKRLYDYAMRIDKYVLNGKEVSYSENAPFYLGYTNTARYDYVTRKSTNILKAKMSPKNYNVILDTNSSEAVSNMSEFILSGDLYGVKYKWGDKVEINASPKRKKFVFMGWYDEKGELVQQYEAGTYGNITLKAKWMVDNNENGIPDEYQKPVKFRVINGSWGDGTTQDYIVYVDLKDDDGNFSTEGKGRLTLPVNMTPKKGYDKKGNWTDDSLNDKDSVIVKGTEMVSYYYSFLKSNLVTYQSEADVIVDEPHTHEVEVIENEKIRVNPNGGTWTHEGVEYKDTIDFVMGKEGMLIRNAQKYGYVFGGWKCIEGPNEERIKYTFEACWKKDTNHDNVGDEYQKVITFKVKNGSWEDNTIEDIVKWVTLEDSTGKLSENGNGTVDIPNNMIANYGYENGIWVGEIPTTIVTKNSPNIYVYEFAKIGKKNVTYSKYTTDDVTEDIELKKDTNNVEYGKKIKVNTNTGIWYHNGIEYTDLCILTIEKDIHLADAMLPYHTFLGWEVTTGTDDIAYVYTAKYKTQQEYNPFMIDLEDLYDYSDVQIKYYYDNVLDENATEVMNDKIVGGKITTYTEKVKNGYILDKTENFPLTVSKIRNDNVIKVYYSSDKNNDKVPDMYQLKVVYRIENGCWLDNTKQDRIHLLNSKEMVNNQWVDKQVYLGDTIPKDMKPNEGYEEEGSWCTNIEYNTRITSDMTYTYRFAKSQEPVTLSEDGDIPNIDVDTDTDKDKDKDNDNDTNTNINSDIDTLPNDKVDKDLINKDNDNKDKKSTISYVSKGVPRKREKISNSVNTRDENNIVLWIILLGSSLILMLGINYYVFYKKKH